MLEFQRRHRQVGNDRRLLELKTSSANINFNIVNSQHEKQVATRTKVRRMK